MGKIGDLVVPKAPDRPRVHRRRAADPERHGGQDWPPPWPGSPPSGRPSSSTCPCRSPGDPARRPGPGGADRGAMADRRGQLPLQDHPAGPRPGRPAHGGVRLRRPGAGAAGGVRGDAALAVRQHPAGASRSTSPRPCRAWSCRPKAAQLAGLAVSSGRSLFVYGPPGNGKSSLGRQIHAALPGDYWIPYCISVGNTVIRVYDAQVHQKRRAARRQGGRRSTSGGSASAGRWSIVGGELTLELLDLIYSPSLQLYEAPPHLKANGGVFLVDDFGRERVSPGAAAQPLHHADGAPDRLLHPADRAEDPVPLRHVLIIATNLSPETVTDPAFLRRMGYRLYLGPPTPEQYAKIFQKYAARNGADRRPGDDRPAAGAVQGAEPRAAGVRAARPDRAVQATSAGSTTGRWS